MSILHHLLFMIYCKSRLQLEYCRKFILIDDYYKAGFPCTTIENHMHITFACNCDSQTPYGMFKKESTRKQIPLSISHGKACTKCLDHILFCIL